MAETTSALATWKQEYTKLLIALKKENQTDFTSGRMRKKEAWRRIAEPFNNTAGVDVTVTGDQCSNKWKKLEDKFKKVEDHNSKTGRNRQTCDFYDELSDFYGDNPKIRPLCPIASNKQVEQDGGDDGASESDEDEDEDDELPKVKAQKKKKRRRSKSSAGEMIEFLREFKQEKKEEDQGKRELLQKMHDDKMDVMNRLLNVIAKK